MAKKYRNKFATKLTSLVTNEKLPQFLMTLLTFCQFQSIWLECDLPGAQQSWKRSEASVVSELRRRREM
jgi:hypothetical protein